jgi:acetyltransferase-like isoleucine patch superfamily enzyme
MWIDQWLVQQVARIMHLRYGDALRGEAFKWTRLTEANRVQRLKAQLAAYGEDVIIREGVHIIAPEKVRIGHHVGIGYNVMLNGRGGITLENFVLLGDNNVLATSSHPIEGVHFHNFWEKPITIKENAWLGANVVVLPGVTIGENAVIGAGAVVSKDIPPNCVAVGVPARVIKQIDNDPEAIQEAKRSTREIRLKRTGIDSSVNEIF